MRDFFVGWELPHFNEVRTLHGFLRFTNLRIVYLWLFFFGWALTPALLSGLFGFEAGRRGLLVILAGGVLAAASLAWLSMHYVAPFVVVIYAVIIEGMTRLRNVTWFGRPFGVALTRLIAMVCLILVAVRAVAAPLHVSLAAPEVTWFLTNVRRDVHREAVAAKLDHTTNHLVIVRYSESHDPHDEWVYNAADIDKAWIVWARDMDPTSNARLLAYFKDREVWLLEPDKKPLDLMPYADAQVQTHITRTSTFHGRAN